MRVRLLHSDRDFDWSAALPWNEAALTADLAVDTLLNAMANGDKTILETANKVVLAGVDGDAATIGHRRAVLQDCLRNPQILRALYAVAGEAVEKQRRHHLGSLSRYPHWVLRDGIEQMELLLGFMRRLRDIAERNRHRFKSDGWTALFAMLSRELDDNYLARVSETLRQLRVSDPMLLSAGLDRTNRPDRYVLHKQPHRNWSRWRRLWRRLFPPKAAGNSFSIHPRDEAGHRAMERLRDQGIAFTANVLAQSKDHVRHFFAVLRAELAFYVGCLNLHDLLVGKGEPICFPVVHPPEQKRLEFRGLYDAALALRVKQRVVGNDANADGKGLVVVTGANQGGKSTFLRSIGLAQLMTQSGMFAPANAFSTSLCSGLFTHYRREEDASMTSGKFDEELSRMSDIVDRVSPWSLILFNESFAATNEREGSEIARQILTALLEGNMRVVFVTHLYDLAGGLYQSHRSEGLFLRADRRQAGARSFRLSEGAPLRTSFGEDLYDKIFAADRDRTPA
jgi:MutS domain V